MMQDSEGMLMKLLVLLISLFLSSIALAEITPPKGTFDPRVRVVNYNPRDVVRITTYYGVSTDIEFGDDEEIVDFKPGDPKAWDIQTMPRHLFARPIEHEADTNLTVITDKRVYRFFLEVLPLPLNDVKTARNSNLIYGLSFKYPDLDAARAAELKQKAENERHARALKEKLLAGNSSVANTDYWVAGSEEISPTAVTDDGRFIHLTFGNNRDIPGIYTVSQDGKESLVNGSVKGNTVTLQRMARKLVLRKGDLAVCVVNKSFNFDGMDNTTGTVSPDVERVIKEGDF